MEDMNTKFRSEEYFVELYQRTERQFTQQYPLKKGLKIFGKEGEEAVIKEVKQQHDQKCFQPKHVKDSYTRFLENKSFQVEFCYSNQSCINRGW